MQPLDYFNAKAAREAAEQAQRATPPSSDTADFFLGVLGEILGGVIEFVLTALFSGL